MPGREVPGSPLIGLTYDRGGVRPDGREHCLDPRRTTSRICSARTVAPRRVASLAAAGARGGFVTLLSQGISLVARTVGLIVLARLIAPDLVGLNAIVVSVTTFTTAVILLGLPTATVQALTLSQRAQSSLFLINTALGVFFAAGLFFSAPLIAGFYDDDRLVVIIQWMTLVPLTTGIQSQFRMRMVRDLRFTSLSAADVISQVVGLVAAIVLAANGQPIAAVIAQGVVQHLAQLAMIAVLARWWPGLPGFWRTEVRELLVIGVRIFAINLLRNTSRSVVVPVAGLAVSPAAIGNYDRAQQLSIMPINLAVDSLQRVAVPILSRLREEPARMLAYMRRAQLVGVYGTATAFLVVAALAQPLVRLVLGDNWSLAGDVLQALAVAGAFRVLGQSMQWLFISAGATKAGLTFSLWSQPAIVVVTLAGLPWGIMGVAIASSLAWAAYWPISTVTAARAAGIPARPLITDALAALAYFCAPVAVAALAARLLGLGDLETVGIGLGFAVAAGALLALLIKPVRRDLRLLWETLRLAFSR